MKSKKIIPSLFSETGILQGATWLIMLACVIMLLFMLGRSSLIGAEGETADALRELLGGKDLFSAESQAEVSDISSLWNCRVRSIPAYIFGLSEFTCRLPSVFAALFMLCGTMLLSKDIFNRATMYTTGWMLLGSCGFLYWGRFAGNYMTLAMWAVWSAVLLRFVRDTLWWRSIFFSMVLIGIAWWGMNYLLLLPGIILIMLPHCRKVFFRWQSLAALGIASAVVFAVLFVAVKFTEVSFSQSLQRMWQLIRGSFMESVRLTVWPGAGSAWSDENIWNLYRLLFPWSLPALAALVSVCREFRKLSESHRCLFFGTMLMLVLTAVFPARPWQYQLPLLPFLLLITGGVITGRIGEVAWVPYITRGMVWIISIFCSFAVAVIVTWPLWKMVLLSYPPLPLMLISPLLGLAGLMFIVFDTGYGNAVERFSGMRGPWSGYVLGGVCVMAAALAVGHPALDIYRSGRPFWINCGHLTRNLPAKEVIFAGEKISARARYYMALPEKCTVAETIDALPAALQQAGTREARLIIRKKHLFQAQNVLNKSNWFIETDKFVLEEGGLISFAHEEQPGEDKFVMCRVKYGAEQLQLSR